MADMYKIRTITPRDGEPYDVLMTPSNGQCPMDETNVDYAAYLEWVAAGNTPEPWQPDEG